MTPAFLLTAALMLPGAPIPKDAPPAGAAPRVVELKPNNEGKVTLTVRRIETVKATITGPTRVVEQQVARMTVVELSDVKDLKVVTAGGQALETKQAVERLKGGGIVVITTDGNPVPAAFLRVFKDDTLVLSSPELTTVGSIGTVGVKQLPQGVQDLPAVIRPGVIARPLPAIPAKD